LGQGWYPLEGSFRWTQPQASARLARPANAAQFELIVNIGSQYITQVPRSHVTVAINGSTIGEHEFTRPGWQTVRWNLQPAPAGPAEIVLRVTPEFYANRKLGIAVGAFGFDTQ
jgi:archaellum component FlaG (FlaF/FlaG flagellin family)